MYSHKISPILSSDYMTPTKPKMFRQGDILLQELAVLPRRTTPIMPEQGRIVLLRGEKSKHQHSFSAHDHVALVRENRNQTRYIVVSYKSADLTHPEHDTISVPKGVYKVIQQRQVVRARISMAPD